jgi:three-Cys-motif partner protein
MNTKQEFKDFYKYQKENSKIKAEIVSNYFPQYARILLRAPGGQKVIRYCDLFAGPGKYGDGSISTPYHITKSCIEDNLLREKVQLLFNDMVFGEELRENIESEFETSLLKNPIHYGQKEVGSDLDIRSYLGKTIKGKRNPAPTLLFFDPFGYKTIETTLLAKFLSNWGNEIFLFFNVRRIHAGIENHLFEPIIRNLYPTQYETIKKERKKAFQVRDRLPLFITSLKMEFDQLISRPIFLAPFQFIEEDQNITSHFVLHLTKDKKGFELVKQVYSEYDNIGACLKNGMYTFDAKRMGTADSELSFGDINVPTLAGIIWEKYKGKTIVSQVLFTETHVDELYVAKHFREALRLLESQNKLTATRTDGENSRLNVVIGPGCILKFSNE